MCALGPRRTGRISRLEVRFDLEARRWPRGPHQRLVVVVGQAARLDVRLRLHDVFSWCMVCVILTRDASGPGLPSPAWRLLEKMQKIPCCVLAARKKVTGKQVLCRPWT